MKYFEQYGIDIGYVIIGLTLFGVLLLMLLVINSFKYRKLNKKYKNFMEGSNGESIEKLILDKFEDINNLKIATSILKERMGKIDETLLTTYQKSSIIKYDAFKEMGGKLSFVLALLNDSNDGFIINSMHSSREGCYTYVKEVIKGESFITLAEEEKRALEEAKNSHNYMM